jgi:hypothetical protein
MVATGVWAHVDTVRLVYRYRGGVETVAAVDTVQIKTLETLETVRL